MIRVHVYEEKISYISDQYQYQEKKPFQEFLEKEDITVKLTISGLTREKAKELREHLKIIGIAK